MAILKKIVGDDDWALYGAHIPDRCFTCGKPLVFPLVYWAGCNGEVGSSNGLQIWLHPTCARKLGENLILDAQNASTAALSA